MNDHKISKKKAKFSFSIFLSRHVSMLSHFNNKQNKKEKKWPKKKPRKNSYEKQATFEDKCLNELNFLQLKTLFLEYLITSSWFHIFRIKCGLGINLISETKKLETGRRFFFIFINIFLKKTQFFKVNSLYQIISSSLMTELTN